MGDEVRLALWFFPFFFFFFFLFFAPGAKLSFHTPYFSLFLFFAFSSSSSSLI